MKRQPCLFLFAVAAATAFIASPAKATFISFEATDNATVQVAGPRSGASGKAFYNMEANNNGSFASFGVADFNFGSLVPLGGTATAISSATLKLTQSNAGFSVAGPVSVYLTDQTGVSIQPANTSLNYVAGNNGAAAVDTDLAPLTLLGSGNFTNTATGDVDSFSLNFSGGALTSLLSAINSGATLRLVTTADVDGMAATYAGFTNTSAAGPTLELEATVVPEPAAVVLLVISAIATMAGCRPIRRQ